VTLGAIGYFFSSRRSAVCFALIVRAADSDAVELTTPREAGGRPKLRDQDHI
jgi:hypothetical protein